MNLDDNRNRSVSVERLLDVVAWLTARRPNRSTNIPQLRDLLRGIHIRLLDDFNQVRRQRPFATSPAIVFLVPDQGRLIQRARCAQAQGPQASGAPNQPMRYFSSREISVTNCSV